MDGKAQKQRGQGGSQLGEHRPWWLDYSPVRRERAISIEPVPTYSSKTKDWINILPLISQYLPISFLLPVSCPRNPTNSPFHPPHIYKFHNHFPWLLYSITYILATISTSHSLQTPPRIFPNLSIPTNRKASSSDLSHAPSIHSRQASSFFLFSNRNILRFVSSICISPSPWWVLTLLAEQNEHP